MDVAVDRQDEARGNRERMPRFVAWLDGMRAVFGPDVKVYYARDGEREAGRRFDDRLVNGRVPVEEER